MSSTYDLLSAMDGTHFKETWIANDSVADAAAGQNDWEIDTIGNASTYALQTATNGVLRATTAATADGDGSSLRSFTDGIVIKPGLKFRFKVRRPSELASLNWRIGFTDSVTATAPTVGVWVESDAGVLSLEADSADHGDNAVAVSGVSTLTSGTTEVVGTWHEYAVVCSGKANAQGGPDEVLLFVDGEFAAKVPCAIDDDEEVEAKILHWQDSGGADAVAVDFGPFEAWIPTAI